MILPGKLCSLLPITSDGSYIREGHIDGLNDREIMKYSGISKTLPHTSESTRNWIQKANEDMNKRLFGIFINNVLSGTIRIDIDWIFRVGTISLAITNKEMHGKGIGTEAIQLISDFAFNDLMLHKLEAGILDGNIASIKAFTKAGYQEEGKKRQNRYLNGKYVDVFLFGKIKANETNVLCSM